MLLTLALLPLALVAAVPSPHRPGCYRRDLKVRQSYAKTYYANDEDPIPKAWDWRDHGYVTAVKSQGYCGSCYIFSAVEAIEGQWKRLTGNLTSLSEQNVLDCDTIDGGCNGGDMENVYAFVYKEGGLDTEANYPYTAAQGQCGYNQTIKAAIVTGYAVINASDADLLHAVATVGPISVAMAVEGWDYSGSGIYDGGKCDPQSLDHGMLVIGYGVEGDVPFWILKNSWGSTWGENGYIRLRRDISNICGITEEATFPIV